MYGHPDQVRRRWREGDNIGIACRAFRTVGLDVDGDGAGTLAAELSRDWPDTFTVRTPFGGRHLYFRIAPGCTVASVSGGRSPRGPGIDVRGLGRRTSGYLIGPVSIVGGATYRVDRDVPIRPLPAWIGELLDPAPTGQTSRAAG
ncbi:bifunctional DNA primase/polymerase [Nocardia sp. NPDC004711]